MIWLKAQIESSAQPTTDQSNAHTEAYGEVRLAGCWEGEFDNKGTVADIGLFARQAATGVSAA
ncbi:hypothetical protein [Nitrobacter sp. TKz-YC02]|uniref:hypothetical protein n=1 Tax=Nitrobacter sp. TKz-YC02 TaxID=3398704 RepID=UPI003CEC703C